MKQSEVDSLIQQAAAHHRAGRLDEASAACQSVLAARPDEPRALHLRGIIRYQQGQFAEAADLLERASKLSPDAAAIFSDLGVILNVLGRSEEAAGACRRAIKLTPNNPDAHYNFGNALSSLRQFHEAIKAYQRSLELRPTFADGLNNLGNALRDSGKKEEAIVAYRKAIGARPNYPEALSNLGGALVGVGRANEAIDVLKRALALRPRYPEALNNLGTAFRDTGRLDRAIGAFKQGILIEENFAEAHNNLGLALRDSGEAEESIAACRRALALRPDFPAAHNNLGLALKDLGRTEEALASYRRALELDPDSPRLHLNMGITLSDMGRFDEAEAECRRAIALQPDFAEAHFNLSMVLLDRGDLQRAWPEYEWRLKCDSVGRPWEISDRRWHGESAAGKTLLLHAEQGLGDVLQFARYCPMAAQSGARVIVSVHPRLCRLLKSVAGIDDVLPVQAAPPPHDLQCPLMSLPSVYQTTFDSIPNNIPYVSADTALAEAWKARLAPEPRFKVGLVWGGNPKPDPNRSMPLAAMNPLGKVPGVIFYSLQKGKPAREAKYPPGDMDLIDYSAELHDFADTAALISQLDLLITIDTSVAHLGGAMGKPTWVLIPVIPDWRWLRDRSDCPWYPTARLFRQAAWGDWRSATRQAADALGQLIREHRIDK